MSRKFKTRRGVLVLTGSVLTALAGCSGGSEDDGSGSGSSPTSEPTPTPTEQMEVEDIPGALETETPGRDEPDMPTDTAEYVDESYTRNIEGGSYLAYGLEYENEFTLEWTVVNELDSSADFDVFLFTADEARIYDEMIRGGDRRPRYIEEGTVQGIEERASETVTLNGGRYAVIVDNSDYGDAGDFGEEDTRRVTLTVETREA